jgi:hypothetical protein
MEQYADRGLTREALMALEEKISRAILSEKRSIPLLRIDKERTRCKT